MCVATYGQGQGPGKDGKGKEGVGSPTASSGIVPIYNSRSEMFSKLVLAMLEATLHLFSFTPFYFVQRNAPNC